MTLGLWIQTCSVGLNVFNSFTLTLLLLWKSAWIAGKSRVRRWRQTVSEGPICEPGTSRCLECLSQWSSVSAINFNPVFRVISQTDNRVICLLNRDTHISKLSILHRDRKIHCVHRSIVNVFDLSSNIHTKSADIYPAHFEAAIFRYPPRFQEANIARKTVTDHLSYILILGLHSDSEKYAITNR